MPLIGNGIGVPFGKKGGGGDAFAIERSLRFDGVNDYASQGSLSTAGFQPFNNKDWTITFWAKSDGTRYINNGAAVSVVRANNSGAVTIVRFQNDGISDSKISIKSNNIAYSSSYTITSAKCQVWQHYAVVVTQNGANQDVEVYVNGTSVDTGSISANTISNTSVDVCLGTANNSTAFNAFKGYISEVGCWETALNSGDIAAIYGGGSGADLTTIGTIKGYYRPLTTDGPTTGTITDVSGNQDCTMNGFVSPYGVTTDTP